MKIRLKRRYVWAGFCLFLGMAAGPVPAQPLFNPDSLLAQMTLEEKIAQMMVVRCGSGYDPATVQDMQVKIGRYGYGGLCFFKSNAWDACYRSRYSSGTYEVQYARFSGGYISGDTPVWLTFI